MFKQYADAREGTELQQFPLIGCSYSERSHKSKSDLAYTDYSQAVCLCLAHKSCSLKHKLSSEVQNMSLLIKSPKKTPSELYSMKQLM